jgi:hypothetical protein
MEQTLAGMVYVFFALSVAHWYQVSRVLGQRPGCGNVITDPLLFLTNVVGPLAVFCAACLLVGRVKGRRRPLLPIFVAPLLLGTSAALGLEIWCLRDYGINLSSAIWYVRWL